MKKFLAVFLALLFALSVPVLSAAADVSVAYASTPLNNSSSAKRHNVELAVEALDGAYIYYGEEFSFNDIVGPRTEDNGYVNALNGRGVKYRGGGVAQVATTLYLALKELDADIRYTEKNTYDDRFTDDYVRNGKDAIVVDSEAGTDFRFYNYYGDMTIYAYIDRDSVVVELYYAEIEYENGARYGISTKIADSSALKNNIELCASSINDTTLCYLDEFSFNDIVGPRTENYGYQAAVNGRGVKVVGGGVAQVASTIWLAVKDRDDIEILEKKTYGDNYNQEYVSNKNDAIVTDYNANTDFRFRYVGDSEMTIYTYVENGWVYCDLVVGAFEEDW